MTVCLMLVAASTGAVATDDPAADDRSRAAWRYVQKDLTVTFTRQRGTEWIAERSDGERPEYQEIGRTDDYVELQNTKTKLLVRLHADRALWRRPRDAEWTPWVKGGWVAAVTAPQPPAPPTRELLVDQPPAEPDRKQSPATPAAATDHRIRLAYL